MPNSINNGLGGLGTDGFSAGGASTDRDAIDRLNRMKASFNPGRALLESEEESLDKFADLYESAAAYKKKIFNKEAEEERALRAKSLKIQADLEKAEYDKREKALLKEARKNNKGKLSPERIAAIKKEAKASFELTQEEQKKLQDKADKQAAQQQKRERIEKIKTEAKEDWNTFFGSGKTLSDRAKAAGDLLKDPAKLVSALSSYAESLKTAINNIASTKSIIDTRLQGSRNKQRQGSYWAAMGMDITGVAGVSPLVKQEDIVNKVKEYVGKGIAFNVEQRAFLAVIKDKIATTFDAADAALVKLVRIQQQDTTAARLGMESALTAFLNNMYETTEYMTDAASSIRNQLYEAEALMGATSAAGFEYQVQKWMGSLYSVGFGKADSLASAFGKLAAGDISGLTGDGMGNLLIMAANKAGLSVASLLSDGIDESETNLLMKEMVEYMAKLYNESKGSNVIAQQLAGVFGLTASDLKAAANLSRSTKTISNQNLNYGGMLSQLYTMANSMYSRTSMGEMLTNMGANFSYTMASGIANNPVLYSIYTMAGMLKDLTGGIAIPAISVFGNMVDLHTTVADLMNVAALSGGILSGMAAMIGGGGGFSGSGMLNAMGVGGSNIITRGNGGGLLTTSGASISSSGYVGNAASSDVKNKALTDAKDDANQQLVEAQDESEQVTISDVNDNVVAIYTLLQEVTMGSKHLTVAMDASGFSIPSYGRS